MSKSKAPMPSNADGETQNKAADAANSAGSGPLPPSAGDKGAALGAGEAKTSSAPEEPDPPVEKVNFGVVKSRLLYDGVTYEAEEPFELADDVEFAALLASGALEAASSADAE